MSQENVEIESVMVRRWLWAFENDAEAFRDILHPDIAWFQIEEDRSPVEAQFKVQTDKVIYIYDQDDREPALEAVGLSE